MLNIFLIKNNFFLLEIMFVLVDGDGDDGDVSIGEDSGGGDDGSG